MNGGAALKQSQQHHPGVAVYLPGAGASERLPRGGPGLRRNRSQPPERTLALRGGSRGGASSDEWDSGDEVTMSGAGGGARRRRGR